MVIIVIFTVKGFKKCITVESATPILIYRNCKKYLTVILTVKFWQPQLPVNYCLKYRQNPVIIQEFSDIFYNLDCYQKRAYLPKELWPYAVQCAAHSHNRCYSNRTKNTPYFLMTGRKPNLSNVGIWIRVLLIQQPPQETRLKRGKGTVFRVQQKQPSLFGVPPTGEKSFQTQASKVHQRKWC